MRNTFKTTQNFFPSLSKLKKYNARVADNLQFTKNQYGVYIEDPADKIKLKILQLHELRKNTSVKQYENAKIRVKLSGDSGRLTKLTNVLNFCFSLIDFENSQSMYENYTLGIFEVKNESRFELQQCLGELSKKLSQFKEIEIDTKKFEIVWYMGGDMKFLTNMLGVNANFNNAKFPCFSCKIPRNLLYSSEGFSIIDNRKGARSHEDCALYLNKSQNMGYLGIAIFSFIPYENYVLDLLHLLLRISDVLFDMLLQDIEKHDTYNKSFTLTDIEKNFFLNKFIEFCHGKNVRVKSPIYLGTGEKGKKQFLLRSLNGNERLRILSNIDLVSLFNVNNVLEDDESNIFLKDLLLQEFCNIYILLDRDDAKVKYSLDLVEVKFEFEQMQRYTANFLKIFGFVYGEVTVTSIYLHSLACHVSEFYKLHGSLYCFAQQGLEKLNDFSSMQYERATNRGKTYLSQIMKKRNRTDFYIRKTTIDRHKKTFI